MRNQRFITTLLAVVIVLFAGFEIQAQNDFKLSDYKNPEYNYRLLDFDFNMDGRSQFNETKADNIGDFQTNIAAFNGMLNPRYYAKRNNNTFQGFQSISLNISTDLNRIKTNQNSPFYNDRINKDKRLAMGFQGHSVNRFYNSTKKFIEIGVSFDALTQYRSKNWEYDPATYPFNYKTRAENSNLIVSVPVKLGKGRIEEVQDARLSVYILEDLEKSGDLSRSPDSEDILELAYFITKIKNKRYFDHRLQKISEITALDSLLESSGLKAKSGASYFTLLNDNWNYSNGPVRESGSRFSFGLAPSVDLNRDKQKIHRYDSIPNQSILDDYTREDKYHRNAFGLGILAEYSLQIPVNLYWQHSTDISAGYAINNTNEKTEYFEREILIDEFSNDSYSPNLSFAASHSIGYYPNSRTSIRMNAFFSIRNNFLNFDKNDNATYDLVKFLMTSGIGLTANYYVSPQLRVNINLHSNYYSYNRRNKSDASTNEVEETNINFQNYISAGLTYSIF
ncbi:MAG: hypothetical protein CVT92_12435 [Bacteroidetes bacterium HGW-Bacteroidetes-1]|jgi:hypothetical protein|nr:MAG: hypothetical protein CVT92_12435 [Bacteroidetes bacterium HGW-Bacteroidetes-1]